MTTHPDPHSVSDRPLVRVRRPDELFTAVPYLLNFHPDDSLVLVTTRERGGRQLVDAAVRVDLDEVLQDPETAAAQLAERLRPEGPLDTLLLVYCEDEPPAGWLNRFLGQARRHGLVPVGGWQITGTHCRDLWPTPGRWRPRADEDSRVAAEFVVQGRAPAVSRHALLPDLSPAPDPVRSVAEQVMHRAGRASVGVRMKAAAAWQQALTAGEPLGPARCGLVHAGLGSVLLRDALLVSCLGMDQAAVRRAVTSRQAAADLFDSFFRPGAPPPDRDRLTATAALLVELVRCAPPGRRAEPLAILAWCAWWAGDGATANQYLELVQRADPRHRLSLLLEAALAGGVRPGWAAR